MTGSLTCAHCGRGFNRPHSVGTVPRYCGKTCRQRAYEMRRLARSTLPITHVPLTPFDEPIHMCMYTWEDDDGERWSCHEYESHPLHDPESEDFHTYLPSTYCQRSSGSHDDRIRPDQDYLALIHGRWYMGRFIKVWYGWSFWLGSHSSQLNHIEDLYEIDLGALP